MVDDYVAVKHGRKPAEYAHPVMKEVLEETHGVMVYQEQVMRILERLGGIELSSAYTCIKAISKKKLETIAAFREQFVAGAKAKGGVLASDAFFPFPDSIELIARAGVAAIVQPGGSKRDAEVIAAADAAGIAMVFTARRHFRH